MADGDVLDNGTTNGWMAKARLLGDFINRVGIPSIVVLFALVYAGAVAFGKIDSPVVTKSQFNDALAATQNSHQALLATANAQTKALEKITTTLGAIVCEGKQTDIERLKCYRGTQPY